MDTEIKIKAKQLRKGGLSYNAISEKLSLPKSTVRLWCKDVELTKSQLLQLIKNSKDPFYGRRKDHVEKQIKTKNQTVKRLFDKGFKEIKQLSKNELFLVGIALYWAEGFKKDSQVGFANSDHRMINLFMKWLKKCCLIDKEDLLPRVTINSAHAYRIDKIEEYWSIKTNIPLTQFRKPFYQNVKWKKEYKNQDDYYGVLRIRVRKSLNLLRKIHGWIAGMSVKC